MGGCCNNCGYNKCSAALVLHHINPEEKDFSISGLRASPKNIGSIIEELKKCVLLCSNCHAEAHYNGLIVKDNIFDESKIELHKIDKNETYCPVCNNIKLSCNITCSKQCAAKLSNKIDWDSIDIFKLIDEKGSIVKAASYLGCSDMSVRKRLKKLARNSS